MGIKQKGIDLAVNLSCRRGAGRMERGRKIKTLPGYFRGNSCSAILIWKVAQGGLIPPETMRKDGLHWTKIGRRYSGE